MPGYAVIDFETTGFVPERSDRVVEVGLVLTDDHGAIQDEWTTLVNPHRDLGATGIHGITVAQVMRAPEFGQIAPQLVSMLRGRAVVAHNASFDMRFLHSELNRCGHRLPTKPEALCTMKWARRVIGTAKLADCCRAVGIELTGAHEALADARATAHLLSYLVTQAGQDTAWITEAARARSFG
jgi:DNA polymerase-3 subunit epsilon